jgi:hypothetical protein
MAILTFCEFAAVLRTCHRKLDHSLHGWQLVQVIQASVHCEQTLDPKSATYMACPHHFFRLSSRSPKTVGSEISMTTFLGTNLWGGNPVNPYILSTACQTQIQWVYWLSTMRAPITDVFLGHIHSASVWNYFYVPSDRSSRCTNNSGPPGSVMESGTETRNFKGVA